LEKKERWDTKVGLRGVLLFCTPGSKGIRSDIKEVASIQKKKRRRGKRYNRGRSRVETFRKRHELSGKLIKKSPHLG